MADIRAIMAGRDRVSVFVQDVERAELEAMRRAGRRRESMAKAKGMVMGNGVPLGPLCV